MGMGFLAMALILCGWVAGEIDLEPDARPESDAVRFLGILRPPRPDKREVVCAEALGPRTRDDPATWNVDEMDDAVHGQVFLISPQWPENASVRAAA